MQSQNKEEQEIFESLILGGLIGAALGTLLTAKKEGGLLGAIAGAAILGTFKANARAVEGDVPVLVEEGNVIYEITSKGRKIFKKVPKSERKVPSQFKLR
jgi:hypothetical protein